MTATDVPPVPPIVGWKTYRYGQPHSTFGGTVYQLNREGDPLGVLLMDGADGTVELWGAHEFLTRHEALSLAELLTAVLRQPVETERYMTGPMHAEPGAA